MGRSLRVLSGAAVVSLSVVADTDVCAAKAIDVTNGALEVMRLADRLRPMTRERNGTVVFRTENPRLPQHASAQYPAWENVTLGIRKNTVQKYH